MQLHEYLASQIVRGTQRKFSRLHGDFLELRMSNSNDVNEQSGSPRDSRNPGNTSGMTVVSQVPNPVAKPVDSKELDGENLNTVRSVSNAFSTEQFKYQAGPRGRTTNGA